MMWILVSSPSMIRSPGRRVMISTLGFLLGKGCAEGTDLRDGLGLGHLGEQRGAHGRAAGLVDHLVSATMRDDDRRAGVGVEVVERLAGPDGDVDVGLVRVGDADASGLRVGDLHLERGEEVPRVRDGDRQRGVLERVQPQERGRLLARDERVARAAEPDQAVRELEDRLVRDLQEPEASAVDCGWHLPPPCRYLRKSRSDDWTMFAPAASADWYTDFCIEKSTRVLAISASSTSDRSFVVDSSTCWRRSSADSRRLV